MYDTKRMLAAALLALTMMPVTMTGCGGPTCGSGTEESDSGECVPTAEAVTCADGTKLEGGTCVLDTSGCGTNTTLENGVCVPAETLCGDKTTFNPASGSCEAAEECGTGTSANDAGECVPAAGACAAGTTLNGDGVCEIATAACGSGTQLDAATGLCALTDTVCGDNTVLANGTCSIIADACATGTVFNDATGTCTPEATCKPGDAISGGLCVTPAEKLFADATVEVPAGKTDPNDGGTPVALTLPAAGTSIIAKGTIEAPYDDDTDPATPDIQDVDYLTFSGTKGQVIRLTVAPTPGSVAMIATVSLDSEDIDWERKTSPFGFGSARYMVLPEDGTYTIEVAPNAPGFDPIGSDDYDYAIELEEVALGAPALASAGISGELVNYSDNFFALDQTNAGDLVGLNFDTLGDGAEGVYVHIFIGDGAGNYTFESTLEAAGDPTGAVFPAFAADIAVLIGYGEIVGTETAFEASVGAPTNLEDLGAIAPDTSVDGTPVTLNDSQQFFTFTVSANQVVEIRLDKSAVAVVDLFGSNGSVFTGREIDGYASSFIEAPLATYFYSPTGGSYTLGTRDKSSTLTDIVFSVKSATPGASTTLALGATDQKVSTTVLEHFRREYFTYEISDNALLTLDAINGGDGQTDVFVYDATTGEEVFNGDAFVDASYEGEGTVEVPLMAGTYVVGVGAEETEDLDSGYTLDVAAQAPPAFEIEPNDDAGTATPVDFATQYALGALEAGNADFFTFQVPADLAAGETWALSVVPDAAFNAQDTYTCRVSDSAGVVAEQIGTSTDCLFWLTGLTAAETYTIELTTTATGPVDYRITTELINDGALETEPNDDFTTNATDAGTPPALGSSATNFYGELTTDGVASDVDAYELTLAADLPAGEALSISFAEVFNVSETSAVTFDLIDPADPTNPIATATGLDGSLTAGSLTAGSYFLVGTRTGTDVTTTARYRMSVARASLVAEVEANDDTASANVVASLPTRITGSTGSCRVTATSAACLDNTNGQNHIDPDYFAVTPQADGNYNFNTASSTFCGNMTLYDTDGTTVLEDVDSSSSVIDLTAALVTGTTYYLYVGGWCGSTGEAWDYDVTVSIAP